MRCGGMTMDRSSPAAPIADLVTFGGSGLDRAGQLRGDAARIAALAADPAALVLPLWRGKPLHAGPGRLGWLGLRHPGLEAAAEEPIFLGLDEAGPRFALDLSAWVPPVDPGETDRFADATEQHHPDFPADHHFAELRQSMTRLSPRDAELAATARALVMWHARHRFCANCGAPSLPAKAGWQRDCPACGAGHFPRTDPVVIMAITHGNDLLVGRSPGWPEGMYSLLAGFIEPGETVEAAVRREVFEEAGIRVGAVGYVVSQPWPFPASLMLACHGTAESREIAVDAEELEDARWVSRETMLDVVSGADRTMTAARPGAVARFVIERWLAGRLDREPGR